MPVVTTREATLDDLPLLLRFEKGIVDAERPFDPTLKKGPNHYYDLPAMIAADHICLLIAEEAGEPVGCGYARIENSKPYLQHLQHAYLGFMYVEPQHRGKGINRTVIEALTQWSLSRGIRELRLDVYHQNNPAITAYEKVGFVKHMIEMRKGI